MKIFERLHHLYQYASVEGALAPRLQRLLHAAAFTTWRMRPGFVGSGGAVGAQADKSQPPHEQGHQIKGCSKDRLMPFYRFFFYSYKVA